MLLFVAVFAAAIWLLVSIFGSSVAGKIAAWGSLGFAAFMFFQWLRENEEEKRREHMRLLELERRVKENDERLNSMQSKNDRL
jgi:hypothetical protein